MRRHQPTCGHCPRVRHLGRDFQAWRAAWAAAREAATGAYPSEVADFDATTTTPTFKVYLVANTGAGWPMSGRQSRRSVAP